MGGISPRIVMQQAAPARREDLAQTLREFLAWLELSKGLRLCESFKPQYDWYMPVPTNVEHLAHEFLGTSADCNKREPLL